MKLWFMDNSRFWPGNLGGRFLYKLVFLTMVTEHWIELTKEERFTWLTVTKLPAHHGGMGILERSSLPHQQ